MVRDPRRDDETSASPHAASGQATGSQRNDAGESGPETQLFFDMARLQRLLDAVVAVSAEMDSRTVLRHIVEAAADLISARYGALGVLGEDGEFIDLITVGVDDPGLCAAMGLPQRHGLLGGLVAERRPLRVADVLADPRSVGYPPEHPVMETLLGVPLVGRGSVYGNLYLAEKRDGTAFTAHDEALLTALASAASVSIENARLYERLKRAAEHFQRSMLPVLPDLAPIALEARYHPASQLPKLGGDWYDALALPDGSTCVVVGDVTGHDVQAAPVMGQIRNMLRALAYEAHAAPNTVVSKLDAILDMFGELPAATLLFGRIERAGTSGYVLRWTNAGHPPPLLITASGHARYLAPERHGIPIGIDPGVPRFEHVHPLPPGGTLLLYTDGLIERRGRDIDACMRDLAEQTARLATAGLGELCDEVMTGRGQRFDDDVALLALRLP